MKIQRSNLAIIAYLTILLFSAISCSTNNDDTLFEPIYIVDYENVITLSREQILENLSTISTLPPELSIMLKFGVTGLRIKYETVSVLGEKILASGALLVPDNLNPMPLISFQHGTITDQSSAPSNFTSEFNLLASVFASTGYIIAMPDYIGYGASMDLPHPYEHRASLATATRDMLRASYEYFKLKKIDQPNNKLFLTGYSEGGFATMATYKLLQEEHPTEFNVTAVTVGAGAYNKTEFMDWVVSSTVDLEYINSFVWVLDVYNSIYTNLQRPYNHYFNEPWATKIQSDGIFAAIERNPEVLLNPSFTEGIKNRTDEAFISAIDHNNCYRWVPQKPLQLYHGTADNYVPYFNSESAYYAMLELGATTVELITIEEGTHTSSFFDYAAGSFIFFSKYIN